MSSWVLHSPSTLNSGEVDVSLTLAQRAADKGYYQSMDKIDELEERIEVVAIGKKGKRTEEQTERETNRAFKLGQKFRAGIEGTISYLKRCLLLRRCINKGFTHYQATIGVTVFAHNLLVLARGPS